MIKYDNKRNKYYFLLFLLFINNVEENYFDFNLSRRRYKFIFIFVKNYYYGNEFNRFDIKK